MPTPAVSGSLQWIDMSNWDHEPIPERQWAIRDRVPLNQAPLFSGEGGAGKSIIELTKDVAHVLHRRRRRRGRNPYPPRQHRQSLRRDVNRIEIIALLTSLTTFSRTTGTNRTEFVRFSDAVQQQKAMLLQFQRCVVNHFEWQIPTLSNVDQRKRPVPKIENPQHSHICGGSFHVSADRAIKSVLSKLWLAFWRSIAVDHVVFYHIERLDDQAGRVGQMAGPYELKIVGRRVILGDLAKPAPLEKSHR